jgi:MFS family permease
MASKQAPALTFGPQERHLARAMGLFRNPRFVFLFLAQLFGAFNDNIFKSALTILMTYKLAAEAGWNPAVLGPVGGALFILPFVLFSATSGQLADRLEKSRFIRWIKFAELLIAATGMWALATHQSYFLLVLLFLMGTHSAVFGPVKYGILPQVLPEKQLMAANGIFEGTTFLAILAGTIYGGWFIMDADGGLTVGATCVAVAALGFLASWFIPSAPPVDESAVHTWNPVTESLRVIGHARASKSIFRAIMGISWFWLVGAVVLSLIPVFSSQVLHADEHVTTFLLGLFSVGVAIGSVLAQQVDEGKVTIRHTPYASLGLTLCGIVVAGIAGFLPHADRLQTLPELLPQPLYLVMFAAFIGLAAFGGLFVVPLNAYLQAEAGTAIKSRIIAACNIYNAIFMVAGTSIAAALLSVGVSLPEVLLLAMLLNLGIAVYIHRIPERRAHAHAYRTAKAARKNGRGLP